MNGCNNPGLRKPVVDSGLEVAEIPFSNLPEVVSQASPRDVPKFVLESDTTVLRKRKGYHITRQKMVLLLIAIALIIIGAVVGAVVGVLKSREHLHTAASNNTTSPTTNTTLGITIREDSAIAVTGWRYGNEYSIRLFYQDRDGFLGISSLESVTGEVWSPGIRFVKAKSGTPIAATCYNQSIYGEKNGHAMEIHVYYLDDKSTLQEFIFKDDSKTGKSGTLNSQNIKPASDTRLAAYWPLIVYQSPENTISETRYNCSTGTTDCWNNVKLDITAHGSSNSLAVVPMGRRVFGLFLYYQRQDEELVNYVWQDATGVWLGEREFAQPIPPSAPIAVLATPTSSTRPTLNFYVLWQDAHGIIQVSWKEDSSWNPPRTFPALNNARNGTQMACLTPYSWYDDAMEFGPELSRCFFVNGDGRLKQVQYGATAWKDMGVVWVVSRAAKA
ncbi:hypothetical protein BCR34DRAFT_183877 [Clohesyomyces aquaticus]|uniref:Uncharacterized protein n=1 Tax=Clohesyomyces aquaticus TaxID=1231657 RepID=A0A1Y1ZYM4_9PLEO|nr:hypothetical protein BCR34DRAFT_183877 [Clohesyomyces aquaticus]